MSGSKERLSKFEYQVLELYLKGYDYTQIAENLESSRRQSTMHCRESAVKCGRSVREMGKRPKNYGELSKCRKNL